MSWAEFVIFGIKMFSIGCVFVSNKNCAAYNVPPYSAKTTQGESGSLVRCKNRVKMGLNTLGRWVGVEDALMDKVNATKN